MILFSFVVGCSELPPFAYPRQTIRVQYQGSIIQLTMENGIILDINDTAAQSVLDYSAYWISPAFIDSHVHLAYLPVHTTLLNNGIAGAVDLASPLSFLQQDLSPLQLKRSGPMLTAVQGYPTQSWGANGYGVQCEDVLCVEETLHELHIQGSDVIKIPLTTSPTLSDEQIVAAVQFSKSTNRPIVAHALSNERAHRAAILGIQTLAHTPTETCSPETIEMWSQHTIISTLQAFGSNAAISNLSQIHGLGGNILYGSDLGNVQDARILEAELLLLLQAGLSEEEIIQSGTTAPAQFWGFSDLGRLEVGYRASFVILDSNPYLDITTLSRPVAVWIDGQKQ